MGRTRRSRPLVTFGVLGCVFVAASGCDSGSIGDSAAGPNPAGELAGSSGRHPNGAGGSGSQGTSGKSGAAAPSGCEGAACETESAVASSAFPRLSHQQWAATVKDLLYLDAAPDVSTFSADAPTSTGFDNNGGELSVGSGLASDYETAAEKQAADLVANATRLAKLMPANAPSDVDALGKSFVTAFGERAYRRPLTAAEVDSYVGLWKQGPTLFAGSDAKLAGVQIVVQAMLLSPSFEYRIELGQGKAKDGSIDLTDYEIASRLSYMFWDSMPDAALFAAAKNGELHDSKKLADQAQRLLADPRAASKVDEFHRQLLELRRYDGLHPAGLPDGIGAAMRTETEKFVHDVVIDQSGSLESLLTASYTFVNKDLAALYGVSGTFGTDFKRADLNPAQRAGLLTQAGFLTYRSGDTAPILRGVFVNQKFLCAELPPPPVFTPPKLTGDTRRERVNSVTGEGTCGASCHAHLINPMGYPLEYFDDSGKYRTQDNGHPVDGSASYPFRTGDTSYDGPIEFTRVVADSAEAHECYVRHWLEFGWGRPAGDGDDPLVARVAEASRKDGISVKDVLVELIQSPSFRSRAVVQP